MANIWKSAAGGDAVRAAYARFLAFWPQPAEHLRVSTSQGETFVIASGKADGPAVVMLHGSSSNSVVWARDAAVLGQYARVYAVDMIGEPGLSAESRPPLASDVYAGWLDEVLSGLGVQRCALVGISLGGWLALQYATAHPEKVSAMVLLCPGGVGRQRKIVAWAIPLLMLGAWGRRRFAKIIGAPEPASQPTPAAKAFLEFNSDIHRHFIARRERLPGFTDEALRRLTMPVLTILGGRDAFIDAAGTRGRLTAQVPQGEIMYLPEAGHFLMGHTGDIDAFLRKALTP